MPLLLPLLMVLLLEPPLVFEREILTLEQLQEPVAACFLDEGFVVLERGGATLSLHDDSGRLLQEFLVGDARSRQLSAPTDAACNGSQVAVLDAGLSQVQVLDQELRVLRSLSLGGRGRFALDRPRGIAFRDGKIAIANTGHHEILVFSEDGTPLLTFGSHGGGPGEFRAPEAVALHADGRIVVADTGNARIQVFSKDGDLLALWGDRGTRPGLFAHPSDLDLRGDALYVTDSGNHRVQVLDLRGRRLGGWGRHVVVPHEGQGRLHYPRTVRLAADGARALACEPFEERCQLLGVGELAGNQAKAMAAPAERGAHHGQRAAVLGKLLALTTQDGGSVTLFDLSRQTPIQIHVLGESGAGFGRFLGVAGVAWLPDGTLVTADPLTRRLQVFELDWDPDAPVRFLPELSRLTISLDLERALDPWPLPTRSLPPEPVALSPGPEGSVLILDGANSRVIVLSNSLAFKASFGGKGTRKGRFRAPTDLCFDESGERIHVVDAGNRRVQTFDTKSRFLSELRGVEGVPFLDPFGVMVARDGRLFVSDRGTHQVHRFSPQGEHELSWGSRDLKLLPMQRLGAGQLYAPAGLAELDDGKILVVDHGNHRAQIFTRDGHFLKAFGSRWYVAPTRGGKLRMREER